MPEIISRREALMLGLKRYFTGIPCRKGHVCERNVDGKCFTCTRNKNRKWRNNNPEKIRDQSKRRYCRHREKYLEKAMKNREKNRGLAKMRYQKMRVAYRALLELGIEI